MTGAPHRHARRRKYSWHAGIAAWCLALGLAGAATPEAYGRPAAAAAPGMAAARGSAEALTLKHALAEDDPLPGAAWHDAARLAGYLRLHHAIDERLIGLSPLAAYAAATRRDDADTGRMFSARRTAAAHRGAPRVH